MGDLENELAMDIEKAVTEVNRPPLRAVPQPQKQGLTEQWSKLQAIDQELRKRIRQERLMIEAQFDKLMVELHNDFNMRVEDAVTAIEADRRKAVSVLVGQTAEKLREHDLLAQRMK